LGVRNNTRLEEGVFQHVTIGTTDVSLEVKTNTGARISGRVLVDGEPPSSTELAERPVYISAMRPPHSYGISYSEGMKVSQLKDTDRFELTGARGPTMIHAELASGALVSITRNGEDIAGRTFELAGTETLDDIVVSLATKGARVHATVSGPRQARGPEYALVILFPEERSRWHQGYARYATVPLDPSAASYDPSPQFIRLPEGHYRIVAVPQPDSEVRLDADAIAALAAHAAPVNTVAGETTRVSIPLSTLNR
jgi:hypothetical protein